MIYSEVDAALKHASAVASLSERISVVLSDYDQRVDLVVSTPTRQTLYTTFQLGDPECNATATPPAKIAKALLALD